MRKMKMVEFSVLGRDVDNVLEFLGRRALLQLSETGEPSSDSEAEDELSLKIRQTLDNINLSAAWLGVILPAEPLDSSHFPAEAEEDLSLTINSAVSALSSRETGLLEEKRKLEETLNETEAFANLNAPFAELDQLSYLTLRVGRLDPRQQESLAASLADRAVIIPLGSDGRFLAAASRKGRFALDSELKNLHFEPIAIPEGYKGVPSEMISGLEEKLSSINLELEEIKSEREKLREEYGESLKSLAASFIMAGIVQKYKMRLRATENIYFLRGWAPADITRRLFKDLEELTGGRIAMRIYNPEELKNVKDGKEKVPVSLKHGAFIGGFEKVVFSYGVPLYGTIDPTPIVAFFFTLFFGIMFGDLGQGMVLLLLGILTGKGRPVILAGFNRFSIPLMAVGISSMIMGFLTGSFFTNENILRPAVRFITGLLTGHPVDRILTLMPIAERGGSVTKLFYFFGFTFGLGVLLNSAGLIVNIVNKLYLKKYEEAFFSKTGLAGALLFWYALFIALRFFLAVTGSGPAFSFRWYDVLGLTLPLAAIVLGEVFWRLAAGHRKVFEDGGLVFAVKGFVEILEVISTYISSSVSFLRVGAFAFSHAALSFTVFWFVENVSAAAASRPFGVLSGALIMLIGNAVIILLEGLIVAIQVIRLQYYEFFSKFFTETGVEFNPFRFSKLR